MSLVLGLGGTVALCLPGGARVEAAGVLVQPDVSFSVGPRDHARLAFVHLDPHESPGRRLWSGPDAAETVSSVRAYACEGLVGDVLARASGAYPAVSTPDFLLALAARLDAPARGYAPDERIARAIGTLRAAWPERPGRDAVARAVGMSPGRFSTAFRNSVGLSFKAFRRHEKLVRSLRAFASGDGGTVQAYAGRFADQAHYSRTFRAAFGTNPRAVAAATFKPGRPGAG